MTDDQMICEALGIPWHEPRSTTGIQSCLCVQPGCGCFRDYEDCIGHCDFLNPDFDTPEGMVTILREGPKQEWWTPFLMAWYKNVAKFLFKDGNTFVDLLAFRQMIESLTPPTLKAELVEFLKGEA